jgi:pimeloyl-ACP methyl ester carboxylesterase
MAYVTLKDGVSLYYLEKGDGPPIVLLQGLTWTSDYFWKKNFDALAKKHRVIAIDLRGQGRSAKPLGGYTIKQNAADLHEALGLLKVERATLVGLAFGVLVALAYVRDFGAARLGKLVLMEGTPRLTLTPGWEFATFGNFTEEASKGFVEGVKATRTVLTDFMRMAITTPIGDAEFATMAAETYQTPTSIAIELIEDMTRQDLRAVLPKIEVPTLLIYGVKNNPIMLEGLGPWLKTQIRGARLEIFNDSGHSPFWDEPEKFNKILTEFASS